MPKHPVKKAVEIAVIGGGTGLTTAWALAEQEGIHVSVFEASDRLGGHIHSKKFHSTQANEDVIMELGAEFIGDEEAYPFVHRLFRYLCIKLIEFELNMDFYNLREKDHIILPPLYHTASDTTQSDASSSTQTAPKPKSGARCGGFFSSKKERVQDKVNISWDTLITDTCTLFKLNGLINAAKRQRIHSSQVITLKQFLASQGLEEGSFVEDFFYNLDAAGWGVSREQIEKFCAHYAMNYLIAKPGWFDAPEGLSSYIDALVADSSQVEFNLNSPISKIVPIKQDRVHKYKLLKRDGSYVVDAAGIPRLFDDVVLATPAYVSQELLADLPYKEKLRQNLRNVKYYDTTLAIHEDKNYLPPHGTIVCTRSDGKQATNTIYKPWKKGAMKTWVREGQPMPENLLGTAEYKHPLMGIEYYRAQQALHRAQGKKGLWFGSILAGDGDSHNSGVKAGLHVAAGILKKYDFDLAANKHLALFADLLMHPMAEEEIFSAANSSHRVAEPSSSFAPM